MYDIENALRRRALAERLEALAKSAPSNSEQDAEQVTAGLTGSGVAPTLPAGAVLPAGAEARSPEAGPADVRPAEAGLGLPLAYPTRSSPLSGGTQQPYGPPAASQPYQPPPAESTFPPQPYPLAAAEPQPYPLAAAEPPAYGPPEAEPAAYPQPDTDPSATGTWPTAGPRHRTSRSGEWRRTEPPAEQNRFAQNGSAQNGVAQNGSAQNGVTQNGVAQNGVTQNATRTAAPRTLPPAEPAQPVLPPSPYMTPVGPQQAPTAPYGLLPQQLPVPAPVDIPADAVIHDDPWPAPSAEPTIAERPLDGVEPAAEAASEPMAGTTPAASTETASGGSAASTIADLLRHGSSSLFFHRE